MKHWHHKIAIITLSAALAADTVCGLLFARFEHLPAWHGLYCALANAVTLGGDVSPTVAGGYIVNTIECLTVVPLFAATLSFFTSGLASAEVQTAKKEILDAQP